MRELLAKDLIPIPEALPGGAAPLIMSTEAELDELGDLHPDTRRLIRYERNAIERSRHRIRELQGAGSAPYVPPTRTVSGLQGTLAYARGHTGQSNPAYVEKFRGLRAIPDPGLGDR